MNLRELRTSVGLTAAAAAKLAGVGAATVTRSEVGRAEDHSVYDNGLTTTVTAKLLKAYGARKQLAALEAAPAVIKRARMDLVGNRDHLAKGAKVPGIASGRAIQDIEQGRRGTTVARLIGLLDFLAGEGSVEAGDLAVQLRELTGTTRTHGNQKAPGTTYRARREAAASERHQATEALKEATFRATSAEDVQAAYQAIVAQGGRPHVRTYHKLLNEAASKGQKLAEQIAEARQRMRDAA